MVRLGNLNLWQVGDLIRNHDTRDSDDFIFYTRMNKWGAKYKQVSRMRDTFYLYTDCIKRDYYK